MIITLNFQTKQWQADLSHPLDISIPLRQGDTNPSCYYAEPVKFETIEMGDFIGSVQRGGSVNYQQISLTPHGNGTHTECYGHLVADTKATLNSLLNMFHFVAEVISLQSQITNDGDAVITLESLKQKSKYEDVKAVVIRTLPNDASKKSKQYSGTNPPYLEAALTNYLAERGVEHLLLDLPSVDREVDGGALSAHKAFWRLDGLVRKHCTITELIYVSPEVQDGLYLLNLQITSLEIDASPSKPVLYKLTEFLP
jgi:arylformamidase